MTSINGQAPLSITSAQTQEKKALQQLSSGLRVNNASDDAVSLAIASRISSDNVSLGQAAITASTGLALLSTANSGLDAISGVLGQLQTLAASAQSGILSPADQANLNTQFQSLLTQVDATASSTQFNGQSLLDGSSAFATGVNFQLGTDSSDAIDVTLNSATSASLGVNGLDISTPANAAAALTAITNAISTVTGDQADIGATSNSFTARASLISASQVSNESSVSALTDADIGTATTNLNTSDALSQANIAALVKHQKSNEHLLALLQ